MKTRTAKQKAMTMNTAYVAIGFDMGAIMYAPNKLVLNTFVICLIASIIWLVIKLNKKIA